MRTLTAISCPANPSSMLGMNILSARKLKKKKNEVETERTVSTIKSGDMHAPYDNFARNKANQPHDDTLINKTACFTKIPYTYKYIIHT